MAGSPPAKLDMSPPLPADGGHGRPDGGHGRPDGGHGRPDGGDAMDGGASEPDGGATMDGGSATVTGLPNCQDATESADDLFDTVAKKSCASGGCHAAGSGGMTFTSGAEMKSSMVGVDSKEAAGIKRITAGNVDQSYVIYKLVNQQAKVGGIGGQMPKSGRLPDDELCKFVQWVKSGAK